MTALAPTKLDTPCLEWTGALNTGYGWRTINGKGVLVHRLAVAEVDGWDAIEGKVVMHLCDNPPCYRYDHLLIGTRTENQADMVAKGRSMTGERHWNRRLTEPDVREIRGRNVAGESQASLGRKFGVSIGQINNIVHRRSWKHVA